MPKKMEEKKVKKTAAKIKNTKSTKKTETTKSVKKVSTVKKEKKANKSSTTKKVVATKKTTTSTQKVIRNALKSEYYDLPWGYNKTIVKILAQTPKKLFVYWEISEDDRNTYIKNFGPDFFETTYPVLIINNTNMNYSFEVKINDFANSWYIDINDALCDYVVELGRKVKDTYSQSFNSDYIYVTHSNILETPNNKILFPSNIKNVTFKNVKNNMESSIPVNYSIFGVNNPNIYCVYDFYKSIYKINSAKDIHMVFDHQNPSS